MVYTRYHMQQVSAAASVMCSGKGAAVNDAAVLRKYCCSGYWRRRLRIYDDASIVAASILMQAV